MEQKQHKNKTDVSFKILWIILCILCIIIVWWVYRYITLVQEEKTVSELLTQEQEARKNTQRLLDNELQKPYHAQYKISQMVRINYQQTRRHEIIWRLIQEFEWRQTSQNSERLLVDDVTIFSDRVTMRWRVEQLSHIYDDQWLLERIAALPFVASIDVPFYREVWRTYEFILEAVIQHDF
jgi:hypothetical protein